MASVPIGGVRVDLTLNSAAFIKDIAKTNAAIAGSTKQMTSQLNRLKQVSESVGRTFGAWITLRATKQVIRFLDDSIELAAKLDNQLGQTARAFEQQGAAMKNAFKLGVAEGFLSTITSGSEDATENLTRIANAGQVIGRVLGAVAIVALDVFTIVIPKAIQFSLRQINNLISATNTAINFLEGIENKLGLNKDYGRIPLIPIPNLEAGAAAFFNLRQGAELAANATNLAAEAQKNLGGAVESTHDALMAELGAMEDTTAAFQARIHLTQQWLGVADTVGQALGTMFKENKAVQMAQTVINTASAIMNAMATLPFPINWAQSAAAAALGAAQIATIASTNPGSGSKALKKSSGGAGKGGGSATAKAGSASRGGSFSQAVTINIVGDVFGPEHFRKIAAGLNDVQRDGTALLRVA